MGYVEHTSIPVLADMVRTVWIQSTDTAAYVQRHLPTGGVEIHVPIGGEPRLLGPLTAPRVEIVAPHTTVVGVRFWPGAAPLAVAALDDFVDQHFDLAELGGRSAHRLADAVAGARSPQHALVVLQQHVLRWSRGLTQPDSLVGEAVRLLMPWHPTDVASVAAHLGLSTSQLRRRCVHAVGMGPKALQRTLRFQGFLALAQAGATASGRRDADGAAGLAVDVGYADQAHLSRECKRLTGLTPSELLGGDIDRCACDHDHEASFRPFLATRARPRVLR